MEWILKMKFSNYDMKHFEILSMKITIVNFLIKTNKPPMDNRDGKMKDKYNKET